MHKLIFCLLICFTSLFSETITFIGTSHVSPGSLWSYPSNWDPPKVPGPGDSVIIHEGDTVTVDQWVTDISSLDLSGGLQISQGSFICNGPVNASGTIVFGVDATLRITTSYTSSITGNIIGFPPFRAYLIQNLGGYLTLGRPGTTFYYGSLEVAAGFVVFQTNYLQRSVSLTVQEGTVHFNGYNQTVNGLTGHGTIDLGTGAVLQLIDLQSDNNFQGAITGDQGQFLLNNGSSYTFTLGSSTGGSSANTYSGLTTVTAGTMILHKDPAVTAVPGNILINGGTIRLDASNQIADSSELEIVNGTFNLNDQTETIGYLKGSGGNVNLGSGTLILSSTGEDKTYSGTITGNGFLIKEGDSKLTLTGNNSFGNAKVSGGTLEGTTQSLATNIENDTNLIFYQYFDGTIAGKISGSGSFVKDGGGKVTYSGTGFSQGSATILDGEFNLQAPITLTSSSPLLTISSSAKLTGIGPVTGDVDCFGTISPGNSIGTITIDGNLTFNDGSSYIIELTPTQSDKIELSGSVDIQDGATAEFIPLLTGEPYQPTSYVIINAAGGVSGQFMPLYTSYPAFEGYLAYNIPNQVRLFILRIVPFSELISPGTNAYNVGKYLDSLSPQQGTDLNFVYANLQILQMDNMPDALDQIHPAIFKGFAITQEINSVKITSLQAARGRSLYDICSNNICSKEKKCAYNNFWMAPAGDFLYQSGYKDMKGFDSRSELILLGYDRKVLDNLFIGLSGGCGFSNLSWNKHRGKGTVNSLYGGLYTIWFNEHFYLNSAAYGAYLDNEGKRYIQFNRVNRKAKSSFDGGEFIGHIDGGMQLLSYLRRGGRDFEIKPNISLDYFFIHDDSFTEKGAQSLNLEVKSTNYQMLRSQLGMNFIKCFSCNKRQVIPEIGVSWIEEIRFTGKHYKAKLVDQPGSFKVHGICNDLSLFALTFSLGVTKYDGNGFFSLNYGGIFGKHRQENSVDLGFNFKF